MTIIDAIILGIVEGLTEFLPISSTGHLTLTGHLLDLGNIPFFKSFEIIIQLGAICAVIVIYYKDLLVINNLKKLIVAFIPTGLIGFLFYKNVKKFLLGDPNVVIYSLIIGGIIIILFEIWQKKKQSNTTQELLIDSGKSQPFTDSIDNISYKQSVIIGLFQSIAIIPGVSRSAASIIGGMSLGLNRNQIVKFSFLLAVPTILVASLYDTAKNLSVFSSDNFYILIIGFLVSFIVAIYAIKFLIRFVSKHSFIIFGVYRIIIALLFLLI